MEAIRNRLYWLNGLALLLVLPTVYFIFISTLKFEFGVGGPYDSIAPFLESLGLQESFGWNINLLIIFGPVTAFGVAALQVLQVAWYSSKEQLQFSITIKKKAFPLLVGILSGFTIAALMFYFIIENLIIR